MAGLKRLFLWLVLCLSLLRAAGQTRRIDQYRAVMYSNAGSRERLDALLELYKDYQSLPKDTLWWYALAGQQLALQEKDPHALSLAVAAQADAFIRWGNTDSAMLLINRELLRNPAKDKKTRPIYFKLAGQKVDCFGDASNYKDALAELYRIIALAEQYHDAPTMARNMNTIGVINYNLDHVPEAFNWYYKALSHTADNPADANTRAALFINLAETYRWVERFDSARYYIGIAEPLCRETENLYYLCNALRVKASIARDLKDYIYAEQTMLQCIDLRRKIDGFVPRSNELLALAGIYLRSATPDKAINVLTQALNQPPQQSPHEHNAGSSADQIRIEYLKLLARAYELKGDGPRYQQTLVQLINAKDSFYQLNAAQSIAELQTKYEVQKKETTIAQQKLDLLQQHYMLYGAILLIFFAALLAYMLFTAYRKKQRYKMAQALDEEKLAARLAVAAAAERERIRIAADLHDNLGAYAASIAANIDHLSLPAAGSGSHTALEQLRQNAQEIVAQLSDTIWVLKKDALSLTAISDRFKTFIRRIQESYPQVLIDVEEEIRKDHTLSSAQSFHLFKILQEALTNALRHSGAPHILISFAADKQWEVRIADDGKGIPADARAGNGRSGMETRAREAGWIITWASRKPQGTVVVLHPQPQ